MPALKDGTGQWGKMVHPGSRVVVRGVKPRVRDGVGAPAEDEQCGGRSQVELSLRAENREVFIFPELPGLRCTSGNAICRSGCGLQTPALKLSGTGGWCPGTGSPRKDKTGQDGKSIPYAKKMHLQHKGRPTLGEAQALPETRSEHKS